MGGVKGHGGGVMDLRWLGVSICGRTPLESDLMWWWHGLTLCCPSRCLHSWVVLVGLHVRLSLHGCHGGILGPPGCGIARHLRCGEGVLEVGREVGRLGRLKGIVGEGGRGRSGRRTWDVPVDRTRCIDDEREVSEGICPDISHPVYVCCSKSMLARLIWSRLFGQCV